MIDLFLHGCGDLHSLVAKMVYPDELKDIPVEQVKKLRPDLRKKAKAPEFKLNQLCRLKKITNTIEFMIKILYICTQIQI